MLPWVALPVLWLAGDGDAAAAAALAVAATLTYRMQTLRWNPSPSWALLLHPVAALVTSGIVIDWALRGLGLRQPVKWKGRSV